MGSFSCSVHSVGEQQTSRSSPKPREVGPHLLTTLSDGRKPLSITHLDQNRPPFRQ